MIFIQSSLGHDLEVTRFSLKANRLKAHGFFEMLLLGRFPVAKETNGFIGSDNQSSKKKEEDLFADPTDLQTI